MLIPCYALDALKATGISCPVYLCLLCLFLTIYRELRDGVCLTNPAQIMATRSLVNAFQLGREPRNLGTQGYEHSIELFHQIVPSKVEARKGSGWPLIAYAFNLYILLFEVYLPR